MIETSLCLWHGLETPHSVLVVFVDQFLYTFPLLVCKLKFLVPTTTKTRSNIFNHVKSSIFLFLLGHEVKDRDDNSQLCTMEWLIVEMLLSQYFDSLWTWILDRNVAERVEKSHHKIWETIYAHIVKLDQANCHLLHLVGI